MKKIIFLSITLCGLIFSSCADFLKEENWVDVEKGTFYNNPKEAETVLLGAYRNLVTEGAYGYHLSILLNLGTDIEHISDMSTSSSWKMAAHNAYTSTLKEVEDTWKTLYAGIYDANEFLERCSAKLDEWETVAERNLGVIYIAEARALRAMLYFELVRRYGNIPLMTSTAQSKLHPSMLVQADPVKVYELIEEDLLYAISILPYSCNDNYHADSRYRFSKGAAMGLLTKVYATWAGYPMNDATKWEAAANMAQKLIYSGKHDLLPNYQTLWENTCNGVWDPTESLIEISMYSPTAAGGAADPCGRIGKWNGVKTTSIAGVRGRCAANVNVVHTFVLDWRQDKYKNDLRRDISIANYQYNEFGRVLCINNELKNPESQAIKDDADAKKQQKNKENYTPAKWDIEKYVKEGNGIINDDKSNVNWYFLRYADVLLLYAEALNEWKGGPTDDAYAAINKVRRRGYGNPSNTTTCDLAAGMTQEEFRQAVRKERAFELAFEGHRRTDLVRWGIYYDTIQETDLALSEWYSSYRYAVAKYTKINKNELLPIPQREKDLCTQFKQNPNW